MARILLVEDDETVRDTYRGHLRKWGHQVEVESDGLAAFARVFLDRGELDLIVLDLNLPGMAGPTLLRAIGPLLNGRVPILVLSAVDYLAQSLGPAAEFTFACVKKSGAAEDLRMTLDHALATRATHIATTGGTPRALEMEWRVDRLVEVCRGYYKEAREDHLTKLPNRRQFEEDLQELSVSAHRTGSTFTVAMIDVDGFKRFNAGGDYERGNRVIQLVAQVLNANIRQLDRVYRYGGDEFLLLIGGTIDGSDLAIVERLRHAAASAGRRTTDSGKAPVTLSCGLLKVRAREEPINLQRMLHEVSALLGTAKSRGGDCVVEGDEPF